MDILTLVLPVVAFCSGEVYNAETGKTYQQCPVQEKKVKQKRYHVTDDGKIVIEEIGNGRS